MSRYNEKAKILQIEERCKASKNDTDTRIVHLHLNNRIFCGVHHIKKDKYKIVLVHTNKENSRIRKLCKIKTDKKFKSLQDAVDFAQERFDDFWCKITDVTYK